MNKPAIDLVRTPPVQVNFASRTSPLARWQTQWVMQAILGNCSGVECREHLLLTQGDRILDKPLPEIGGKGLFTQELEAELLAGKVQAAVHSLKDLPVETTPGIYLAAIPARGEVRDVIISKGGFGLMSLPEGASLGSSSLRRSAQIQAIRPDLQIRPLRGNVESRIRKALKGEYEAIVLAGAGVMRLGLGEFISEWLSLEQMLPAPGQGALAVQCRAEDNQTRHILQSIEDESTRRAVTAERAFLAGLGGGCALPVAAYAVDDPQAQGRIHLTGLVISTDGRKAIQVDRSGDDPQTLGLEAAQEAISQGALEILKKDLH